MNDKTRAAMQQALEALVVAEEFVDRHSEDWYISGQQDLKQIRKSIAALREALAEQAEQKQMAVLDITYGREPECYATPNAEDLPEGTYRLYAAPVQQAEQEPVAWVWLEDWLNDGYPEDCFSRVNHQGKAPLYAAHVRTKDPCNPLQDLTDDEIAQAVGSPLDEVYLADFRAVIAAHKEKNK